MSLKIDIDCYQGDFSLSLHCRVQASFVGLFGLSGAGKSTLLKSLMGLVKPARGRIVIGDQVVFDHERGINLSPNKRPVGLVFQEGRLFPHMDVGKNLQFAYRLTPRSQRAISIDQVVEVLELHSLLGMHVQTLSGGQRQRVALARTLLTCPKLLLLDEPLSALDANSKQQILPLLQRVQKTFGMDIVMVSHCLNDLLLLTDQLLLLHEGRLAGQGSVHCLMRQQHLLDLAGHSGVPNVLDLQVHQHDRAGGVTHYESSSGGGDFTLKGSLRVDLAEGTNVRAMLPPDEIALAWAPVEYISMQNQCRGVIQDVVYHRHGVYCCVNVGFELWVRVTPNAIKQLALEPGKKVWCLFKTFSFKILEAGAGFCMCQPAASRTQAQKTLQPVVCSRMAVI